MENRPLSVAALLIAASACGGLVQAADEPDPAQLADWERRNRKAGDLIEEARQMHQEAKRLYAEKSLACHQKFQVNACLSEAHREQSKQIAEARRVENQGKALERDVDRMSARIAEPLIFDGHELCVSASIGISVFPDDGDDADGLEGEEPPAEALGGAGKDFSGIIKMIDDSWPAPAGAGERK